MINEQPSQREAGFTLVEMVVVLFIIGLIIAIALPHFKSTGETARDRVDQVNRKLISTQADQYYLEYGSYPSSVEELVRRKYLRSLPTCPSGKGKYLIQRPSDPTTEVKITCSTDGS